MTRRLAIRAALLGGLALTSACTTLGGHVSGDFTCRAPAGTCAPTVTIDAKAVDHAAEEANEPLPAIAPMRLSGGAGTAGSTAGRSAERTLTIVFPSYVDRAGVLHDEATVHTVVEAPRWLTTPGNSEPSRSPAPSSLRELVAGASAPAAEGLEPLPTQAPQPDPAGAVPADMPSANAIEAARAGHRIERPNVAEAPVAPAASDQAPGKISLEPRTNAAAGRVRAEIRPMLANPVSEPILDDPFRPAQPPEPRP